MVWCVVCKGDYTAQEVYEMNNPKIDRRLCYIHMKEVSELIRTKAKKNDTS
jgi:hypothetical protein